MNLLQLLPNFPTKRKKEICNNLTCILTANIFVNHLIYETKKDENY